MWDAARRLAGKLKPDESTIAGKGAVTRKGVIVSYAAGLATVTVGGDATEIPNVPVVPPWDGVDYAAGDNVRLIQEPPLLFVLCKLP